MNWKQSHIELGTLRVGQATEVKFEYIGPDKDKIETKNIIPGCSCSNFKWDHETGILTVIYTPNPIPPHLKQQGKSFYPSKKHMLINYGNNVTDKVTFAATITK